LERILSFWEIADARGRLPRVHGPEGYAVTTIRRQRCLVVRVFLLAGLVSALPRAAVAQLTTAEEERLQILSEPEALKKKLDKDRNRPPYEFFRSHVAPFEVLPYVKAYHWSTLTLEVKANEEDYEGALRSYPVRLVGMPHEVSYLREARLIKDQQAHLAMQVMLTRPVPKEWALDLVRAGALRPDASWQASLMNLEPHQMLVMVLSKEGTNQFATWNRMSAMIPGQAENDGGEIEKQRYYRLVLPADPEKVLLSPHPLVWSTISHVIWDGLPPDTLSVSQQQAMLDWLHWGGQLVITGGAGAPFALFRESFLGPYLPADATGETVPLAEADLRPLSQSYRPPTHPASPGDQTQPVPLTTEEAVDRFARAYQPPAPIRPAPSRPVYLSVLRPDPGASTIPLGESSPALLAVERRVGRGRITMLTINPNDPSILAWPGLDTLVRRVVLRRPEEPVVGPGGFDGFRFQPPRRGRLLGQELSWYRVASRDIGGPPVTASTGSAAEERGGAPPTSRPEDPDFETPWNRISGVADWRDSARMPVLCRDLLKEASGITIPSPLFVMKVILAYLIAIVPLNWLVCRFLFNRREWAWLVVPVVALGFAVGVERMAARDVGYETACDEIDLLEVHGDYPRSHLSRVASLYTTGRSKFAISYPNDPTAVVLPMSTGQSIRSEEISGSSFQCYPVPALLGLEVQPRSLAMYRGEQMLPLSGAIRLKGQENDRRVVNGTELDLRDAILIDFDGSGKTRERFLGTIPAGASVEIGKSEAPAAPERFEAGPGPDPNPILSELRTTREPRAEDFGEIRLVAWVSGPIGGQVIEPTVDRHRGFTAVLVHLRSGNPPSPDGPRYDILANEVERRAMEELLKQGADAFDAAAAAAAPSSRMQRRVPRKPGTSVVAPRRNRM
jgi:hypothetical protein